MRKKRITVIIGRMFCGGAFNLWNRQNKTRTAMKLSAVVMLLFILTVVPQMAAGMGLA